MILSTILLITFIVLMVTTIIALGVGGAAFILVFGDVIVCMAIIIWIVKRLTKRKK